MKLFAPSRPPSLLAHAGAAVALPHSAGIASQAYVEDLLKAWEGGRSEHSATVLHTDCAIVLTRPFADRGLADRCVRLLGCEEVPAFVRSLGAKAQLLFFDAFLNHGGRPSDDVVNALHEDTQAWVRGFVKELADAFQGMAMGNAAGAQGDPLRLPGRLDPATGLYYLHSFSGLNHSGRITNDATPATEPFVCVDLSEAFRMQAGRFREAEASQAAVLEMLRQMQTHDDAQTFMRLRIHPLEERFARVDYESNVLFSRPLVGELVREVAASIPMGQARCYGITMQNYAKGANHRLALHLSCERQAHVDWVRVALYDPNLSDGVCEVRIPMALLRTQPTALSMRNLFVLEDEYPLHVDTMVLMGVAPELTARCAARFVDDQHVADGLGLAVAWGNTEHLQALLFALQDGSLDPNALRQIDPTLMERHLEVAMYLGREFAIRLCAQILELLEIDGASLRQMMQARDAQGVPGVNWLLRHRDVGGWKAYCRLLEIKDNRLGAKVLQELL
ncbi:hypothetical protein [Variovorax saccharolyticus]|uniref:hypothetical protein n=1 Tax=Variovorax saccharolyticus TaxID=3053516 RepID=UPI0025752EA0|nr:hypothetical protein [Variovorax sp. J31P216]MDM0029904.1 hypothetical protein [Variovorax sp. J31P216]